jgi:zinc transport system substrate-binding protein
MRLNRLLAVAVLLPVLAACASTASEQSASNAPASSSSTSAPAADKPKVVAAFYPLQYAAQSVGGDLVNVANLTQPGVEPHDLELSAQQVAEIAEADLVLYIKGFQPAVDEAIEQQAAGRAIDVSAGLALLAAHEDEAGHADEDGHEHGMQDPHVWLNPINMALIGTAIKDRLSDIDSANAAAYMSNSEALRTSMTTLDQKFSSGLGSCTITTMVVSHEAFAYLAEAYGFTQVGISGLSPEAEPSPARIKDVANIVTQDGVTTVYYETLVDPKVAQTLADETGATTAVLDPLEGLQPDSDGDYISVMESNLATLKAGQACS